MQWNPSCEANPFAPQKCPSKRDDFSSGVKINAIMFRFTLSSDLSIGGRLSSGWPLKRGSTVLIYMRIFYDENTIKNSF